jgi:hypothetical protein
MWPPSLEWVVAQHTDAVAVYAGGPADLVDRLVADPGLEADPVTAGTPVDDWVAPEEIG